MLTLFLLGCSTQPEPSADTPMRMLDGDLKAALCSQPCSGPGASLQIWRAGDAGPVTLITHSGDLAVCSHPPTTWHDTTGATRLTQEERPVGPAEAEAMAAERDALTAGLTRAERLSCP